MFRKIALTFAAIGFLGSASAALAAPNLYQTQNARAQIHQRDENTPISQPVIPQSPMTQDSRLQVYRLLVQAGPAGIAASDLAERVGIPANTLSFHLKTLSHADLVVSRQDGRFIYYSANYEHMNALLEFLTENCCGGKSCKPAALVRKKRAA